MINGRKWFTTAADGARFAIVMAVTDPDATEYQRASMIIVPTDTPGFKLVRNIPVFGHAGDDYTSHAEIEYDDVRVPEANLLGPRGLGFLVAQERLGPGRIHHCMRWIGICERSFDLMCQRAATREIAPGQHARHAPDRAAVDRRVPRRDQRRAPDGAARGLEDRHSRACTKRARRSRA